MKTCKALSALIDYPGAALLAALPEIRAAVRSEAALGPTALGNVLAAADMLATNDLLTLQERWVSLFDRMRSLSLHLFEHVHGDSRERGPAMVDLIAHYAARGLTLGPRELPDYLPVVLEFAAQLPPAEVRPFLAQVEGLVAPLQTRLAKRGSPYAGLMAAVRELAGSAATPVDDGVPVDDPTLEEIDRDWAEAEVRFAPGEAGAAAAGCGKAAEWAARINGG
jgi:nitrate reductase delta subunit